MGHVNVIRILFVDIPLVPSLITGDPEREPNFILHWLNNKEMHFTMQAESILQELTRKVVEKEEGLHQQQDADHTDHDSEEEGLSSKLSALHWYMYTHE